jgi:hypothetical protein
MSPANPPTDAHRAAVADALLRIELKLARKPKPKPIKLQPELFLKRPLAA